MLFSRYRGSRCRRPICSSSSRSRVQLLPHPRENRPLSSPRVFSLSSIVFEGELGIPEDVDVLIEPQVALIVSR